MSVFLAKFAYPIQLTYMKTKHFLSMLAVMSAYTFAIGQDYADSRALWGSVCGLSNATSNSSSLNKVLVSWRMLPGDNADTSFDLYRKVGENNEFKINGKPIKATNYRDNGLSLTSAGDVTYRLTYAGEEETLCTYVMNEYQRHNALPYISIPLTPTKDVCDIEGMEYQANDVSVGDLDGDGEMEIVVKRLLAHGDNDGTGSGESPLEVRHTVLYEAYKLDGTML